MRRRSSSPCRPASRAEPFPSGYDGSGMPQDVANYRIGLIETVILLLLLLLAFGAITIMARERWLALGVAESLLARLAAAVVAAAVAVTGLSGVVLNLVQGIAFSDTTLAVSTSRNQAVVGVVLA